MEMEDQHQSQNNSMLSNYDLNLKFYRIINGYYYILLNNTRYKIIYPSIAIKYIAEQIYVSILQDSRFETEYISENQLQNILKNNNIWIESMENDLTTAKKQLDQYKVKLFQYYDNTDLRLEIKQSIEAINKTISLLLQKKHSFDYLTLNNFAESVKNQYIISQCIFDQNNNSVFDDNYENLDQSLLYQFIKPIEENQITATDLRNIVKTDLWKSFTCQDNVFGPSINLNDDQKNLLSLERMYNNVRQHPECPDDKIINDDDALDGWFLYQKDKAKTTKKKNEVLKRIGGKINKHDNVYILTDNIEEHKSILDMNDNTGKAVLKSIDKAIQDKQTIDWKDIPAVKQDILFNKDNRK